jgi:hypothetical protein
MSNLGSPYFIHTLIMVCTCQPGMCHLTLTIFSQSTDFFKFMSKFSWLCQFLHIAIQPRFRRPGWLNELDYLTTLTCLSPIRRGFASGFVNYKKGCTRLTAASDKVYQLLAHGWWFSSGNIAESGIKHQKLINQST